MRDKCTCGSEKDTRSKTCRTCFLGYDERPTKVCTVCKIDKPVAEFRLRQRTGGLKPRPSCMSCEAASQRERAKNFPEERKRLKKQWEERNPDKQLRVVIRRSARQLGLDPYVVEAYYEEHDGRCEICGRKPNKRLSMDHCHTSGKFRGLLCNECNFGLGNFRDSVEFLEAAVRYLQNS